MTDFFIKPYSFVSFVDEDWLLWKARHMTEARLRLWEKHEENMPPPDEEESSSYAYAGNQTKIPILWDQDDWKFLVQFPPAMWSRALQWRYNEGLIEASKLRDEDPEHSIEAVPNNRNELVFKNEDGKKYIFSNVYTGFRNLLQRLEKPIKYHGEHNPPGVEAGSPGLKDIDPFQTDPNHQQHPSKYGHGLMDYDVTHPVEANDDYIDAIPDDQINLPTGQARTPEAIAAARERMKKSRQHTFSGMSVLQPIVTSKLLNTWIKAQGLGLLGNAPNDAKDPHTNEPMQVSQGSPKDANAAWDSHTGQPNETGQRLPLQVPIIKRNLNYKIVKPGKNGGEETEEPVSQEVKMPYLNPGVLLPRLIDLSPEQRQKFAERGGFDVTKSCPGIQGLNWADIEMKCKAAKQAGQPDDLYNIVRNFDILTPEQRQHMVKNQRGLLHLASAKFGNNKEDLWSQPGQHYAVGFTPNKAKREILPSDMSKEQLKIAMDKYYDKLLWEADKSISYFLNWARRYEKLPPQVLDMMDRIKTDLSQVCAALIGLNLNHPNMGIRDPEVGLVGVEAKADKKELEVARKNYAFNFARDLSQAAFGDVGSRRARQKHLTGGTVSLDAPSGGDDSGSLKDVQATKSGGIGAGGKMPWYTRRQQLNPETMSGEEGAYPIARLIWNVPQIGHKIDKFFQTQRNRLAAHVGGQYAQLADKARDKLKIEVDAMQELILQAGDELSQKGVEGADLEKQAQELALQRLPEKLKKMRPDLYGNMGEKDLQALVARNKQVTHAKLDPQMQQAEDEYMEEFFTQIINGKKWPFPQFDQDIEDFTEGPEMDLSKLKDEKGQPLDAKGVVSFMSSVWSEQGARKFAVPLLMAISKNAGQPMDETQAQQQIAATGLQPEGVAKPQPKQDAVPITQPEAKPAMAATNLSGMLAQLPTNPGLWKELSNKQSELLKPEFRNVLQTAATKIRKGFAQRWKTHQIESDDENNAYIFIVGLLAKIAEIEKEQNKTI